MTTLREAAQQALKALKNNAGEARIEGAINILEAALAEFDAEPTKEGQTQTGSKQEPGAWIIDWPDEPELGHYFAEAPSEAGRSRPLYTHPAPQRQPLTQYEAWEIWDALADRGKKGEDIVHAFARAIEKAHGITGEVK